MKNKYILLFTRESRFGLKVITFCIMIFAVTLLWKNVKIQAEELQKANEEKQLVVSMPQMEKEISEFEAKGSHLNQVAQAQTTNLLPVINGVWIQDDFSMALSGDNLLKEGDSIGQFTISKITEHKVILTDPLTNLNKEIDF
jgi:hypothetical protein